MSVPLLDLKQQHDELRDELREAVGRVLDSQQFVLGEEVRLLEEEIADYSNARHAVGCASGTDALLLALMALDIGPGDEVVTTPFSFFATASTVWRAGARPVFADIDAHTYNLDPARLEAAITARTKAIMPVHLYGQVAEMDAINEIAARHNLPVIEDAAQAIGAELDGRRAGSLGRVAAFSFYPTKNLGGAGDGGMLSTDDDELAARLRRLRVHGGESEYLHREVGLNSRLDAIQAAVLRVKLPRLDSWSDARRARADTYTRLFAEARTPFDLYTPRVREGARHIFHQYVVRVPAELRDALMGHLRRHGVGTKIYYPVPLHLQGCFRPLGYAEGDMPESERAARETLALPVYPELTDEQQRYVVETISGFSA